MTFNDLARKRYSCRKLAAKPVEREKIDAIIEAGLTEAFAKPGRDATVSASRSRTRGAIA